MDKTYKANQIGYIIRIFHIYKQVGCNLITTYMKFIYFLAFTIFITNSSCTMSDKDLELSQYNSYTKGDTLTFKNIKNEFQLFLITDKSTEHPNWNPGFRDGWNKPTLRTVKYVKLPRDSSSFERDLITINKLAPNNIQYSIDFESFFELYYNNWGANNDINNKSKKNIQNDTITLINNTKIFDYYEFVKDASSPFEGRTPQSDKITDSAYIMNTFNSGIDKIILSKAYGIVRFKTRQGMVWDRINLK